MSSLPKTSREIIARLLREGWVEQPKNASSHRVFKKAGIHENIVVPHPKRDFGRGILNTLYKQAGWK